MSNTVYPVLPGLAFGCKKRPMWATRRSTHVSGKEARASMRQYPQWFFSLQYNVLRDRPATDELHTMFGFFNALGGGYDTFLFTDPDDYHVTDQVLGTGDGSNTVFTAVRTMGSAGAGYQFDEPVGRVRSSTATVKVNGSVVTGWTYTAGINIFTLASAPALGAAVTATFDFYFVCSFLDDDLEGAKLFDKLWEMQKVEFKSNL